MLPPSLLAKLTKKLDSLLLQPHSPQPQPGTLQALAAPKEPPGPILQDGKDTNRDCERQQSRDFTSHQDTQVKTGIEIGPRDCIIIESSDEDKNNSSNCSSKEPHDRESRSQKKQHRDQVQATPAGRRQTELVNKYLAAPTKPQTTIANKLDDPHKSKTSSKQLDLVPMPFSVTRVGKSAAQTETLQARQQLDLKCMFEDRFAPAEHPDKKRHEHQTTLENFLKRPQRAPDSPKDPEQLAPKLKIRPVANPHAHVYAYMVNNLIELAPSTPRQILMVYMKELAAKHGVPYNKIMVRFGIEKVIHDFLQGHQIEGVFNSQYICSELQELVPKFLASMALSSWFIIRKIARGLTNRFRVYGSFSDEWVISFIRKKKKVLREGGANLERIMRECRDPEFSNEINMLLDEPCDYGQYYEYGSLSEYLLAHEPDKIEQLQPSDDEILDESDRQGLQVNLKYYAELREMQTKEKGSQPRSAAKHERLEPQLFQFQIVKIKSQIPQNTVFETQYKSTGSQCDSPMVEALGFGDKIKVIQQKKVEKRGLKVSTADFPNTACKTTPIRYDYNEAVLQAADDAESINQSVSILQTNNNSQNIPGHSGSISVARKTPSGPQQAALDAAEQTPVNMEQMKNLIDEHLYHYVRGTADVTIQGIEAEILNFLTRNAVPLDRQAAIVKDWFQNYLAD